MDRGTFCTLTILAHLGCALVNVWECVGYTHFFNSFQTRSFHVIYQRHCYRPSSLQCCGLNLGTEECGCDSVYSQLDHGKRELLCSFRHLKEWRASLTSQEFHWKEIGCTELCRNGSSDSISNWQAHCAKLMTYCTDLGAAPPGPISQCSSVFQGHHCLGHLFLWHGWKFQPTKLWPVLYWTHLVATWIQFPDLCELRLRIFCGVFFEAHRSQSLFLLERRCWLECLWFMLSGAGGIWSGDVLCLVPWSKFASKTKNDVLYPFLTVRLSTFATRQSDESDVYNANMNFMRQIVRIVVGTLVPVTVQHGSWLFPLSTRLRLIMACQSCVAMLSC